MKFVKEKTKSGKTFYYLAVGLRELRLLRAIVVQTKKHMPATFELMSTRHTLNNMSKILSKTITKLEHE